MGFRIKISKKLKFTATAFLMMFAANTQTFAQKTSQAVMAVTVRVVSAPQFIDNIVTDISDQLQENSKYFSFGEYSIKFPKGTGYAISFDPVIKMKDKNSSWDINTSVQQKTDKEGKLTLSFTGKSTTKSVEPGQYVGRLMTRIDYH